MRRQRGLWWRPSSKWLTWPPSKPEASAEASPATRPHPFRKRTTSRRPGTPYRGDCVVEDGLERRALDPVAPRVSRPRGRHRPDRRHPPVPLFPSISALQRLRAGQRKVVRVDPGSGRPASRCGRAASGVAGGRVPVLRGIYGDGAVPTGAFAAGTDRLGSADGILLRGGPVVALSSPAGERRPRGTRVDRPAPAEGGAASAESDGARRGGWDAGLRRRRQLSIITFIWPPG